MIIDFSEENKSANRSYKTFIANTKYNTDNIKTI